MHLSRIFVLVGTVIAALSLMLKVLIFDGVDMLPALSRDIPGVPASIPTIFASLDPWAKIMVVVSMVVIVVLAVWPPVGRPQNRPSAGVTTVIGGGLFVYTFVKFKEAQDEAAALQAIFDRLEAAGSLPFPLAMSFPNVGFGFLLVLAGTALVAIGGVLGLVSRPRSVTPAPTDGAT